MIPNRRTREKKLRTPRSMGVPPMRMAGTAMPREWSFYENEKGGDMRSRGVSPVASSGNFMLHSFRLRWRGDRVAEGGALLRRCTPKVYPGFESRPLRHICIFPGNSLFPGSFFYNDSLDRP